MNPIGIVCALDWEAACLPAADTMSRVRVCGIGAEAATLAARALLAEGAGALVSFGSAGALSPRLSAGDLLLPESVIAPSGERLACCEPWLRSLGGSLAAAGLAASSGPLLQASRALSRVEQKAACRDHPELADAVAVDMESAAIAAVAEGAGRPFVAVRAVLDSADQVLPEALIAAVDARGRPRPGRLCKAIAMQPGLLRVLFALARARHRCARTLRRAGSILVQLPATEIAVAGRGS